MNKLKKFSFFKKPIKNTKPDGMWTIEEVFKYITTSEKAKRNTELLRSIKDEKQQREFKAKNFDFVTFSGTFTMRSAEGLLEHSGLLVLDIDHVGDGLEDLKSLMIVDKCLQAELVFTSPSGDGLKVVVEIDLSRGSHLKWFYAVKAYIDETYGISIDEKCKDVGRACFLPYDNEAYFRNNN